MATKTPLIIAYSGTLEAYEPPKNRWLKALLSLVWTYKNNSIDASTRSALYLIKAVAILKERFGISPDELSIQLWGNIDAKHLEWFKSHNVSEYFTIEGFTDKNTSMQKLSKADLLFLPLERATQKGQKTLFIPGKLYDYLKLRKPILALCEASDCKDLVMASGLGFCFEPDQAEEIAKGLFPVIKQPQLLSALKPNEAVITACSFSERTKSLASVFNNLLNDSNA
jgi:hypothetical protein